MGTRPTRALARTAQQHEVVHVIYCQSLRTVFFPDETLKWDAFFYCVSETGHGHSILPPRKVGCAGYPRGLRENQIPLAARIFSIVDAYDAMLYDRPYRKGLSKEELVDKISSGTGKHYDPELVKVFMKMLHEDRLNVS